MLKRNKTKNESSGKSAPPAGADADLGDNTPDQANDSGDNVEAKRAATKAEVSEETNDVSPETDELAKMPAARAPQMPPIP